MRDSVTDKRTLILLHSVTDLKGKTKCLRKYTRAITISLAMFSDDKKIFFFLFSFYLERKVYSKSALPKQRSGLCPCLLGGHLCQRCQRWEYL